MTLLTQLADGVWVRQSEWVWTNSIVVRGEDGLILVDPGIDGSELNQLADDLDRLGSFPTGIRTALSPALAPDEEHPRGQASPGPARE
jgi:glyoxylase-like metal-dependent hydrolase (beta-lactamase superfamily II)